MGLPRMGDQRRRDRMKRSQNHDAVARLCDLTGGPASTNDIAGGPGPVAAGDQQISQFSIAATTRARERCRIPFIHAVRQRLNHANRILVGQEAQNS